MFLEFQSFYQSIKYFSSIDLPDFTVITGLNGSGKTHLLEAIEKNKIIIDGVHNQNNEIRLFNWLNLVPQDKGKYDLSLEKNKYWQILFSKISLCKSAYDLEIKNYTKNRNITIDSGNLENLTEEEYLKKYGNDSQNKDNYNYFKQQRQTYEDQIVLQFCLDNNRNINNEREVFINLLKSKLDYSLLSLTEELFYEKYSSISLPVNMFQQSFGQLFISYWEKWNENQLNQYRAKKGEKIESISDEEFYQQNGKPPWEFVNQILEDNNLEFKIDKPEKYCTPYEPKLIHQLTKEKIKFNSLSSGEKILMSFALCLYHASDERQTVNYPKVLLFDEIDAPLHPSMTLSVLNTIQKTLVKEKQIKVILTTHSPSTVALSPKDSLYVMNRDTRCLEKTTKDKALSLLTSGIPTLSVNYENRKQIFVESKYDVKCYEKIYKKLRDKLNPEISLNFINIGVEGENCDQVKDIVNKFVEYGNKNVYGIIDWDLKNKSNGNVKVLGEDNRYTIENYIFDPLLVGLFLFREKHITVEELNLAKNQSYMSINNWDDSDLQKIVDFICNKIKLNLNNSQIDLVVLKCKYIKGNELHLPKWFLQEKGHNLYKLFTDTFHCLKKYRDNSQKNQEDYLKTKILDTVFDDLPEFLSVDFINLFKEIQQ